MIFVVILSNILKVPDSGEKVLNYIIFSDVQRSNCPYLENIFQNDES